MFELITDILTITGSLGVLYMVVRNSRDIRNLHQNLNWRQNSLDKKLNNIEKDISKINSR